MKSLSAALVAALTLGSGFATAQTVNAQPGRRSALRPTGGASRPAVVGRLRPRRRRHRRRRFRPLRSSRLKARLRKQPSRHLRWLRPRRRPPRRGNGSTRSSTAGSGCRMALNTRTHRRKRACIRPSMSTPRATGGTGSWRRGCSGGASRRTLELYGASHFGWYHTRGRRYRPVYGGGYGYRPAYGGYGYRGYGGYGYRAGGGYGYRAAPAYQGYRARLWAAARGDGCAGSHLRRRLRRSAVIRVAFIQVTPAADFTAVIPAVLVSMAVVSGVVIPAAVAFTAAASAAVASTAAAAFTEAAVAFTAAAVAFTAVVAATAKK